MSSIVLIEIFPFFLDGVVWDFFSLFNTFLKKGNEKWKERNKRERAVTAKKCNESQKRRREYPIGGSLRRKRGNMAIKRKGGRKEERIVDSECAILISYDIAF